LHIVLVQPEIPQNTGNIGRTCVALRAKLWLVRPLGFRLDQRHMRRAALDYWQHLDWQGVDHWAQLTEFLSANRMWMFSRRASEEYTSARFSRGDVLVFGSETQGLPPAICPPDHPRALRIPMHEHARSLNLANAVAVAGYEAARQLSAV
jgi:tRNA (cytidine/uridine-2'-O-)-methyltransferase